MIRQISINKNKRGVKPRKKGVNHRFFVINDFLKEVVDKRNIHFHNHIQISHQNERKNAVCIFYYHSSSDRTGGTFGIYTIKKRGQVCKNYTEPAGIQQ